MSEDPALEATLADLDRQVDAFARIMSYDDEHLWHEPAPGEWSAAMAMVHMSDAEVHVAARLRYVLTAAEPTFANWDEEAHAGLSSERSPEIALAVIAALRAANADLVRRVSPAALARTATLPNGEVVDVAELLARHARHTAAHLEQAQAALGS